MTSRRGFLGALGSLLGAAGVGTAAEVVAAVESAGEIPPTGDVATIVFLIDRFGGQAVAERIVSMTATGSFTVAALLRDMRRTAQREKRARKASERRERHGGDEVLYRGPLRIWQQFSGREVRSQITRRRVLVGDTDREYAIAGIGVPHEERRSIVERDDDGMLLPVETVRTRSLTIPAGSRVLIDLRRGLADVMAAEVVRTADGRMRLHLWLGAVRREHDDSTPLLRGGVFEIAGDARTVGLLGLPI